jgi:hypothetical protein
VIRKEIGELMNRPAYHIFRSYKSIPEATSTTKFTSAQDATLLSLSALPSNKSKTGRVNWTRVASGLAPFTGSQCKLRYRRIKGAKRGRWTRGEDGILKAAVNALGESTWEAVALRVEGRTGLQCRERWVSSLKKGLKKGGWSNEEEARLVVLVEEQKEISEGKVLWADVAQKLGNGRNKGMCRSKFAVLQKRA